MARTDMGLFFKSSTWSPSLKFQRISKFRHWIRSMVPAEQDKINVYILKCAFVSNSRYDNKGLWFSTCRKYDFFSNLYYFNRVSCGFQEMRVKFAILSMSDLYLSNKCLFRTFDSFTELSVFHVENVTMLI